MGMSIDESLEWLISRKEHYEMDDNCQELAQALDVAIDTMNKYQKIQEIHKKWFCDYTSAEAYTKISEVLKDGNNNQHN